MSKRQIESRNYESMECQSVHVIVVQLMFCGQHVLRCSMFAVEEDFSAKTSGEV